MLTDVKILGCFFHLAKALKTKVDTKRMKNTYENYEYFRTFVKHATAISSLPSDKLIDGFNYLQEEFNFEEENKQKFKIEFLIYLKEYWIEGPYPPQVWLNFERNQDLTNNNQEATNSRINKDLKQTHPLL